MKLVTDPKFEKMAAAVAPFTMTSVERLFALYRAVAYIQQRDIPGDFVECGVWRGGSAFLAALCLDALGDKKRRVFLFDTFEGMTPPEAVDVGPDGVPAAIQLKKSKKKDADFNVWAYASRQDVEQNMKALGLDSNRFVFCQGRVEETVPSMAPAEISLLRLDTDWYASTHHELVHLHPRLSPAGVLIVDDYGHWQGARKAVDEYFSGPNAILLSHVDYTGVIGVKT